MNGVLVVDKSAGPTSHDVVAMARKALREKKVGHTGTLDPVATGVLPLVLGQATKIAQYLSGSEKTYRATIRLGISTQTLDAEGPIVAEKQVTVGEAEIRAVLPDFTGAINQIPPMFSAKKIDGQRLYTLARKGVEIEREPKKVTIHRLDLISVNLPDITVETRCSAGTYVRVLAKDIGDKLGCGGHLHHLRRLAAGCFALNEAVTLDELVNDPEAAKKRILPISRALGGLPRIDVPSHLGRAIVTGYQLVAGDLLGLDTPEFKQDEVLALFLDSGELLAVSRSLFPSSELASSRRDRPALKTDRVLFAAGNK